MGFLDIILAMLLIYGLYKGLKNGFFVEIASLVALIAGLFGAIHFSYIVGDYLSEKARSLAEGVGICGFVHDSINLIELTRGGPEHSFLEDPDVKVVDATAQMIWIDDQGFITVVFFINVDGDWLIDEIRYST